MFLYRLLAPIAAAPYLLRQVGLRLFRGQAPALGERLGHARIAALPAPLIWVHAASNGELASARSMIERLLARAPDLHVLITTNTETGRALADSWSHDRVHLALAPLDLRPVMRRFLDHWQPRALVVVENELWPERFAACKQRQIPVLIIGARLSARSHRAWRLFRRLGGKTLGAVSYLSAQDAASDRRFRDLGLTPGRIGPVVNLKSTATASRIASALPFPRHLTLLAASTHPGEEDIVLRAFATALRRQPQLRLILAPRHPRRSRAIADLITGHGLTMATRSRTETPQPQTQVYLADSMGEMDLWYASAGMCFTGGSLIDHGGHTPFEPAAHGTAILHGPHTANSAAAYKALRSAGASVEVTGADTLADALIRLANPQIQGELAEKARLALGTFADSDGLDQIVAALASAAGLPDLAPPVP